MTHHYDPVADPDPDYEHEAPGGNGADWAYGGAIAAHAGAVDFLNNEPEPPAKAKGKARRAPDTRPEIIVGAGGDLTAQADSAISALAPHDVYQRGGTLVDYVRDVDVWGDDVQRHGIPRVRALPFARLIELADAAASYWRPTNDGRKRVRPPTELVQTVVARGQWKGIRVLRGVTTYPVMRADGSILDCSGYDERTGYLAELPDGVSVPDRPTKDDASHAADDLIDLVRDFPISTDAARSAWLAALLTPLARPAVNAPIPMLLLDANSTRTGKTLLADVLGAVVLGQRLPRRPAPREEEEWRKAMLAIAVAADPIVLVDNVTRTLRSAALDAVLTGTHFKDRLLGKNEELVLAINTMFIVTANNAGVSADLVGRTLHCRLVTDRERPERRTDFTYQAPDHALENRAHYLAAALTILRAYQVAGRPSVEMRPMGSYERWSDVVRAPLVWLGLADPATTQDELRDVADVDRASLAALLCAWADRYGEDEVTVATVMADYHDASDQSSPMQGLRCAIDDWIGAKFTSKLLGRRLHTVCDAVCSGRALKRVGKNRTGATLWRVVSCL